MIAGFTILSLLMVGSALFIVTAKKPVYSVVGLLLNFVALAATYLTLHAEFLAVIQIVVYSGAILILFVFVIALLSSGVKAFDVGPDRMPLVVWPALLFGIVGLGVVTIAIVKSGIATKAIAGNTGDAGTFGSVADFGQALFTKNLLPFEVTAFILMVAVIGVVLLAGDDVPGRVMRRRRGAAAAPPREPIAR